MNIILFDERCNKKVPNFVSINFIELNFQILYIIGTYTKVIKKNLYRERIFRFFFPAL